MSPSQDVTARLQEVSPTEAAEWLHTCAFDGQRPIRPYHVSDLASLMQRGHFRQGSEISFARLGKQRYLVNGQHTLSAMVQSGLPQLLQITAYTCKSEADIADLYARFDRHLRRSPQDAMAAYGLRQRLDVPHDMFRVLYGATALLTVGFMPQANFAYANSPGIGPLGHHLKDIERRARIIEAWGSEAEAFAEDLRGCQKFIQRVLLRVGVLSVALVTYRFTGSDATDFWQPLARDDGMSQDDPRKTLLNFLLANPASRYAPHLLARYVAGGWNSGYAEEKRSLLRVTQQMQPIRIDGTPHDGKAHMVYIDQSGEILHDPIPLGVDPQAESGENG